MEQNIFCNIYYSVKYYIQVLDNKKFYLDFSILTYFFKILKGKNKASVYRSVRKIFLSLSKSQSVKSFVLLCLVLLHLESFSQTQIQKYYGIGFGTTGVEVVGWINHRQVAGEASLSYMGWNHKIKRAPDSTSDLVILPHINALMLNGIVLRKIYRQFSLKAGGSIALINRYKGEVYTTKGVNLDGVVISPEDFGYLRARLHYPLLSPLLGVQWQSKFDKSLKWEIVAACSYRGKPGLDLEYEGFLETTNLSQQIPQLEKNLAGWSYYPVLSVRILWEK